MTKAAKEQIQYLLMQYLEDTLSDSDGKLLFKILDSQDDDTDLEQILEELIASEPPQQNYERKRWELTIQTILNAAPEASGSLVEESRMKKIQGGRYARISKVWRVAAVFILAIGIASLVFVFTNVSKQTTFATDFGKTDTIALPDNSTVVLNANSSIQYDKKWQLNKPRELWLKGEAFFDIKHISANALVKPYDCFIVHVKNATIEVLGTRFNVRERRGKTEIVLLQGRIKISFEKNMHQDMIMKPGQMVTIDSNQLVTSSMVNAEDHTTWKNKKLMLTDASLLQITEYLEDNFGKRIVLSDPTLGSRIVEGTFKLDNLEDAILFLTKALNLEVVEEDDTIFITPK